ncbi:serine--tRNA ligase [Arenicella sp. 4NH20-0111]|uniref:serine--tRNA ligase n=1 Tax=Arenicella sp. 4NH20-0111 TaxID=3127648 RepID=UPI00310A1958
MLDPNLLRSDIETIAQKLTIKGFSLDINSYQELEAKRKSLQVKSEELQALRKAKSKDIGKIKAQGGDVAALMNEVNGFAEQLKTSQEELEVVRGALHDITSVLPNVPHESVPAGKTEDDNIQIAQWGEPRVFDFSVQDHVDLGEQLNGLDFELATKITGSRFVVMRGALARMNRALIQYMLDTHTENHGYQETYVPYLANAESLTATGQLSKFGDHDLFAAQAEDGYYLIPTAEVPVTNIVRDVILSEADLPLKMVAHTPCFRREAGSYGRDTRGMIRQHQFEKVELVQVVHPDNSYAALDELTGHAEAILQGLELPYRKVVLCGGDLGFSAAKTFDLEVWLPGQNAYREISSCSNFEDFQARRLMARFRGESKKTELLHTINGSGLAVGRTLLAIMENCQQEDGSIVVPTALRGYMNGLEVIEPE